MPLISQQIKNFVHGVSQQPDTLRHPEQLEEQINAFSTESAGLQKRPPTLHIAALGVRNKPEIPPLVHTINRDEFEQYTLIFDGEGVEIFDLQGNRKAVTYSENTKDYLFTSAPRDVLKVITIADYTFIVNTLQTARLSMDKTADKWGTQGALINIKSGQYGRIYRIVINGTEVAAYETPDGSQSSHSKQIATDYIVERLVAQAVTTGYEVLSGSSWLYIGKSTSEAVTTTVTRRPSTTIEQQIDRFAAIKNTSRRYETLGYSFAFSIPSSKYESDRAAFLAELERCRNDYWDVHTDILFAYFRPLQVEEEITVEANTNAIETVEVYDGYNNQAAFGILKSVQKFANLPVSAPDGFTVKVAGETGSTADDYYVQYDATEGIWKETVAPDIEYKIDNKTMPHVLIRQADGTFLFKEADWAERDVGDDDSNPVPSFIDQPVNDLFFFRNRLGFIAGENVILTRSADFFNFWITSTIELQDTDPIDLAVSDNKVATLYHAVPFGEELLLFSASSQFILKADGVLSPKTARLSNATDFASSLYAKPQAAGRNVYFTVERATHSLVKEYGAAVEDVESKDAEDVTSHVPSYIPNTVHKIIPSTIENLLLFLTTGAENRIYIYKYLFLGGQRQQASWSYWEFKGNVLGADFIGSDLYLVIERAGHMYLEKMNFSYNTKDFVQAPYHAFMDRKCLTVLPEAAYDNTSETTALDLRALYGTEDALMAGDTYHILETDGTLHTVNTSDLTDDIVTLQGNLTGVPLIVGQSFEYFVRLSEIMVKKQSETGTISLTEGRLQVQNLWVNHNNTGEYIVAVNHRDKGEYTYTHTGRTLGTSSAKMGILPFDTGEFKVPVQGKSSNCYITIKSSTPNPVSLTGAGWSGIYHRRTRQY